MIVLCKVNQIGANQIKVRKIRIIEENQKIKHLSRNRKRNSILKVIKI